MKGNVEVFAIHADGSEELLLSEHNLVVNGAGESIVDMLTTPSSVLGITPRVMDTSNWRFGALSFGPAGGAFSGNGYFFPEDKIYMKEDDLCNGVSANVSSFIDQISTDRVIRLLWSSPKVSTTSSYVPPYRLPSYPDPLDQKLEDASTAYSIVSGDGTQSFGHFENRIQFNPVDASSYFQGAYAPYSAGGGTFTSGMLVSSYEGDFQANVSANIIAYNIETGKYNEKAAMDYRGYITTQYNAPVMGTTSNYLGRVYVSGSTVNGLTGATSQCAQPTVTVTTKISQGDVWSMNLYGGLHQIGLWNMDTPTALLANEAPFLEGTPTAGGDPKFINSSGITKQEFKLFAKKTFTNDLTFLQDKSLPYMPGFTSYVGLKLQWTLDLRSQHD